jgi:Ca2+-binding RTX toxin-like protein
MFTIMSYFGSSNTNGVLPAFSAGPQYHDIAATQRLYGANLTTRTGDTIYGFNSNTDRQHFTLSNGSQGAVFSVWDAGGVDTMDFSGYSENAEIDLRPGAFSSVGPTPNGPARGNVSIAVGVVIENAIGGGGADLLIGNDALNRLDGGLGDDILIGGLGADTLTGGGGRDRASYESALAAVSASLASPGGNTGDAAGDTYTAIEILVGSEFADTLSIAGASDANSIEAGGGADTMTGGGNFDYLFGGAGDDVITGLGGPGDFMDGQDGIDTVSYAGSSVGLTVFLGGNQFNTGEAVGDIFFSIENLIGSAFADLMGGTPSDNVFTGGAGSDWLIGQGGNDTFIGGADNDLFDGGEGADRMEGGSGIDVAFYRNATSGVTANMVSPGVNTGEAAGDTYFDVENIWGSDFNDTLAGADTAGQVYGFAGDDVLIGNGGDDVFYGGLGRDTVTGGSGAEDFFFLRWDGSAYEGGDTFTDFQSGVDRITVSRFWFGFGSIAGPAAALTTANAAFVTTGAATDGRPTFLWNSGSRELWFDPDGTGGTAPVLLATLQQGAAITLADIWTA